MTTKVSPRTRESWQAILRGRGIRPTKSMGQHFLVDPGIAEQIVSIANLSPGATVVEIGPGLGMLTRELATAAKSVLAIELDRDLKRFLDEDLAGFRNVRLIEGDALGVDVATLVGDTPYVVVANLPYSSGTAIVRRFLELSTPPTTMTVMLQREVAERLVATPPAMSLLTLATAIHAEASLAMIVPPDVFVPAPKVESAIVHLVHRDEPLAGEAERTVLFRLATMAFQRKRKTLGNGLAMGLDRPKSEIDALLSAAGVDPRRRPQTLSVEEWLAVARMISP